MNLKMSGKTKDLDANGLMMSSEKKSAGQDLENLDINLDEMGG